MNERELCEVIRLHALWLNGQEGGKRADLSYADLREAYLARVDLAGAYLVGADFRGADLQGSDLARVDLARADLRGADLRGVDLEGAFLAGTDLRGASLRGACLREAYLARADLEGADLRGVDLESICGPAYYSVGWSGHGELGRHLLAVVIGDELKFFCGCFSGTEKELRKYIEEGDKIYKKSRLRALEIILELHNEVK